MTTNSEELKELDKRLIHLTALVNSSCVWKRSEYCLTEHRLKTAYKHHHPFCTRIKSCLRGRQQCIQNDTVTIAQRIRISGKAPFVQECHAGALELVVPIWGGERILGAVLCGPFRGPQTAGESGLPPWRQELTESLPALINLLIPEVANRLYGLYPYENPHDSRIIKVLNFIAANYRDPITLKQAAALVYLSPSRLSHLFKASCGVDFSTCLLEQRLHMAKGLLADTRFSIGEVAGQTGFPDQAHFATMFRKVYGKTPSAYRRSHSLT